MGTREVDTSGKIEVFAEAWRPVAQAKRSTALKHQPVEKPAFLQGKENIIVEQFLLNDRSYALGAGVLHRQIDKILKIMRHAASDRF